jgi:hypothetical protein
LSTGLTCRRTDPALLDVTTVAPTSVLGLQVCVIARLVGIEHSIATTFGRRLVFDVDAITVAVPEADVAVAGSGPAVPIATLTGARRTGERDDNQRAENEEKQLTMVHHDGLGRQRSGVLHPAPEAT